jgi:hypothetical protein
MTNRRDGKAQETYDSSAQKQGAKVTFRSRGDGVESDADLLATERRHGPSPVRNGESV